MNHLDLQHHKYTLILNHKYFPLVQPPANLRSQYGRGHLGSRLRGRVSHYLSHWRRRRSIQPAWVAANCKFEIDGLEMTNVVEGAQAFVYSSLY
jgi:hypothetical protein